MDQLTEEIHRLLNAPYAVSLKRLHSLTQLLDAHILVRWADSHACEVQALANAVVDSLASCLYALPVLERLATVTSIRDAVLENPIILDQFLKRGAATKGNFEKHKRICNVLLAEPLPPNVPYPATIVPFFLGSLKHSLADPSLSNLRLTYTLVSRQCFELLKDSLHSEHIRQFEEKLVNILGQSNKKPVHLLCLGIFARLISSADNATSSLHSLSPGVSIGSRSPCQADNLSLLRKFFSGSRVHKTVGLVTLRAIEACSTSSGLSGDERLETLQLGKAVMDTVEPGIKDNWVKENENIMQKLHEKVLQNGLGSVLQSAAFDFLLCVVDAKSLPKKHVQAFRDLIRSRFQNESEENPSIFVSVDCIERMACYLGEGFVHEALRSILDAVIDRNDPTVSSTIRFRDYQTLLCGFSEAVTESSSFRKRLLSPLCTNEFSRPLREFCRYQIPKRLSTDSCKGFKPCWTGFHESRRRVATSICQLVLKAALHSAGDSFGIELSLANNLLRKLEEFAVSLSPCLPGHSGRQALEAPLVSLLEQPCTPQTNRSSVEWKNQLAKDLLRDATKQHELILRTVGNVCKDLEERCGDTEAPLLKEKEKLATTQASLDGARQEIAALELEAVERKLFLDGLEAENSRLENCFSSSEAKAESLTNRLQDLESLLQESNKNAHEAQMVNLKEAKDREIAHMACLTDKGQTIAELERRVLELQQGMEAMRKELENCIVEKENSYEKLLRNEERLRETSAELQSEKEINSRKDTEIRNLDSLIKQLMESIETLKRELGESLARLNEIECEKEEMKRSFAVEIGLMRRDREDSVSEAAAQIAQAKRLHSSEINKLRLLLRESEDCLASARQENNEKVMGLEKEVKKLSREREERAREFAEAQKLSKKLITVMGINNGVSRPLSNSSTGGTEPPDPFLSNPTSQRNIKPKQPLRTGVGTHDKKQKNTSGKGERLTRSFESSSSSRSGPTPKRLKIRNPNKSPTMQPSNINHTLKTKALMQKCQSSRGAMKDISAETRNKPIQALKDTGGKLSQPPVADVDPGLDGKFGEFDDFSFTESELLASTQLYDDTPTRHKGSQDLEMSDHTTNEL